MVNMYVCKDFERGSHGLFKGATLAFGHGG
jgi:hypothetical protein